MSTSLEEHDTSGFAYDHNGTTEAFQKKFSTLAELKRLIQPVLLGSLQLEALSLYVNIESAFGGEKLDEWYVLYEDVQWDWDTGNGSFICGSVLCSVWRDF